MKYGQEGRHTSVQETEVGQDSCFSHAVHITGAGQETDSQSVRVLTDNAKWSLDAHSMGLG